MPLTLEVIGTTNQIENFLVNLSDLSGRLIIADQIKMDFADNGLVTAEISGNTFFNPLPKTIGSVDTPIPVFNDNYRAIFNRILAKKYPVQVLQENQQSVPVGKENLFL